MGDIFAERLRAEQMQHSAAPRSKVLLYNPITTKQEPRPTSIPSPSSLPSVLEDSEDDSLLNSPLSKSAFYHFSSSSPGFDAVTSANNPPTTPSDLEAGVVPTKPPAVFLSPASSISTLDEKAAIVSTRQVGLSAWPTRESLRLKAAKASRGSPGWHCCSGTLTQRQKYALLALLVLSIVAVAVVLGVELSHP